jgi:hypothetical protein
MEEAIIEHGHLAQEGVACVMPPVTPPVVPSRFGWTPLTEAPIRPKKMKCKDIPIVPLPPMEYFMPSAEDEALWRMVNNM